MHVMVNQTGEALGMCEALQDVVAYSRTTWPRTWLHVLSHRWAAQSAKTFARGKRLVWLEIEV